nr:immunoglobulin heavy chain junction region [Macaca mulatta]MPN70725.1 immunoglobulin heavy chain junction region [Macaca mulatta]MPN70927.1 immunoglobulin heavy chain junction region [Macaca mulatta]MPN71644.1 immunoglobulin heavy chain junction region [Macaca mulatta]MPN72082.1 immunoglobulin heavy chain junction region [Macaca mulatta]
CAREGAAAGKLSVYFEFW